MKHMKIVRSVLLCTLSLGTTIQAEINKKAEKTRMTAAEQAQMEELAQFAESAVVKAFNALQKIENKLTEIALVVKKSSNKFAGNPAKIMNVLTENKMTVNALLQNQATVVALKDPIQHLEIAFVISEFCNAFIPYLTNQIANSFRNARPFNLNSFLKNINKGKTRGNVNHLEPASLSKGLSKTRAQLKLLDATVKNIGLTWYNKVARAADRWIVTPANKWHVPTVSAYTGGAALLGAYSLWSYGYLIKDSANAPKFLKENIKSLYDWLGGPIVRNRSGNPKLIKSDTSIDELNKITGKQKVEEQQGWVGASNNNNQFLEDEKLPNDASLFATFDFMIKDFMLQTQPIGSLAATFMLHSLYKAWKENVYPELIKKRDKTWNFLRGGEYLNTFQPGLVQLKPTVSFKDMVGLERIKEEFYSIIQYIDNPEQLMRIEATPEKGWLLTGPPRTGKTFSVECLCGEIELMMAKRGLANKMKFFNINAALVNEYGIKAILDEVYENAPAVIFIDEIDLLGLTRVGNNKLLSEFLTSMQTSMNADPAKIVIVIAATNRPENIDSALRQNGRFGKEIRFDYPSKKYRAQFLARELTNMALNIKEFNIENLTNKTNNKTFEDLKRVIRDAMKWSWMHGSSLTQELLEASIDTELHKLIMFNQKELPEGETRIVATHFAGIALAAMHLETHELLDKVTLFPYMTDLKDQMVWDNYSKKDDKDEQNKIKYGKLIKRQLHDTINAKSESTIINEATILLAGFAAEELLLGTCGFTCHSEDRDNAYKMIEELVFGGLKQEALPKSVREELKTKAYMLLKQCHENAMNLLKDHHDALVAITDELMKKQILNDKEVQEIIDKVEKAPVQVVEEQIAEEEATEEQIAKEEATEEQVADDNADNIQEVQQELN